ncbi:MAG: helix-turn-helix transcriptional regulator [Lachnospiraceae bacterium]|nr:helix-turn-helix transcriptional regulator [Lachnospiraceae bacterium]
MKDTLRKYRKDVQQYLGLGSVQSVYHWLNGLSMPTIDNLYALSELFELPIDAMVCGNRSVMVPDVSSEMNNSDYQRMYSYYTKLNKKRVA